MCGRFTLTIDPGELRDAVQGLLIPDVEFSPRYNIAPTQPIAVIPNTGENRLDFFVWGLIPSWAKDPTIGSRLINARSESLAEKPSFRSSFRRKRCLILADGFYEWRVMNGSKIKQPVYIHLKNKKLFAFAGLWDTWFSPEGSEIKSCTIITTQANSLIAPFHDRMPVILNQSAYSIWLDTHEKQPETLSPLLQPYPADGMALYDVSRMVNDPANDRAECVTPI